MCVCVCVCVCVCAYVCVCEQDLLTYIGWYAIKPNETKT